MGVLSLSGGYLGFVMACRGDVFGPSFWFQIGKSRNVDVSTTPLWILKQICGLCPFFGCPGTLGGHSGHRDDNIGGSGVRLDSLGASRGDLKGSCGRLGAVVDCLGAHQDGPERVQGRPKRDDQERSGTSKRWPKMAHPEGCRPPDPRQLTEPGPQEGGGGGSAPSPGIGDWG